MSELNDFAQTAKILDIPRYILELWLKKFPLFQPKRSKTGVLGFTVRDIALGYGLKYLLMIEKKTISDVQKIFNERGIAYIIALGKEKMPSETDKNTDKNIVNTADTLPKIDTFLKNDKLSSSKKYEIKDITAQLGAVFGKTSEDSLSSNEDKTISPPEGGFEKFEENWRGFMYGNGKAVTAEEIRAKRTDCDTSEDSHDLVFIDDDPLVTDIHISSSKMPLTNNYSVITSSHTPSHKKHITEKSPKKTFIEDDKDKRLEVEKKEKIYHILAKLDILKSELYVTRDVIVSILKAFGYSGFGDAYGKHDNKSVY